MDLVSEKFLLNLTYVIGKKLYYSLLSFEHSYCVQEAVAITRANIDNSEVYIDHGFWLSI